MQDVTSMTGISEEMVQELHSRNNSLQESIQALEEGQKVSHLQNEQLQHQKSALQDLIGGLYRDEKILGTSYNSSSRLLDTKHDGRSHVAGSTSPHYQDYRYDNKYSTGFDNRHRTSDDSDTERKLSYKEFQEPKTETYSRYSRADQFSTVFEEYPSRYSSYEYKDFGRVGGLY